MSAELDRILSAAYRVATSPSVSAYRKPYSGSKVIPHSALRELLVVLHDILPASSEAGRQVRARLRALAQAEGGPT